ncbi:restriction endonuclease [Haloarcula laminariae]|uniref:restriction endonuclease n=1 Tax=Haloarcula laminariae TaxID=2961577 RepID=UPI0021C79233|nr:restriction endonuclease [Halomicroarcula laminariae]
MPERSDIQSYLDTIDPYEFEELIAEIWEQKFGYTSKVTPSSQDRGIDIVAEKSKPVAQKILIQAKLYQEENKVGSREIRDYATLYQQDESADRVVLVCTGGFTSQAKELAQDLQVDIFDREEVVNWLVDDNVGSEIIQTDDGSHAHSHSSNSSPSENSANDDNSIRLIEAANEWLSSDFIEKTTTLKPRSGIIEGTITGDALYNSLLFHIRIINCEYGKNEHDTSESIHFPLEDNGDAWSVTEGISYLEGMYQIVTQDRAVIDRMDEMSDSSEHVTKIHEESVENYLIGTYGHEDVPTKIKIEQEFRTVIRIIQDIFEYSLDDIAKIEIESETPIKKASRMVFD